MVEQVRLGGTCVNVGCVPKKLMFIATDMSHKLPAPRLPVLRIRGREDRGPIGQRTYFDCRSSRLHATTSFYVSMKFTKGIWWI
ncbi:glutathione-disulfide reductase [Phytophthora cinnamomi]|uniref:glutathione-disulfide reductase n=1 Tax=Phytophthora cinnamomi TaxID=4785 RepID=UPI00355A1000|nr:glutathione-disulfide reductase [Phytophthora cinnamomi]